MLTVRGNSIHFRHTNVCSWESVKVFETENVSTATFGFMPNALIYWAIRARHLLFYIVEYWLWWYRYFRSKVNIWNVNCARATAFIFDTRKCILWKVSKFLRQKNSRPEGDSNRKPFVCSWESIKVFETENVATRGGLEPQPRRV